MFKNPKRGYRRGKKNIHTTRRARAIDILFFSGEAMLRDADRDNECVAFNHLRLRAARS